MTAMINNDVAVYKAGIIKTPNYPMLKFSLLVIQLEKRSCRILLLQLRKSALIHFHFQR